MTANGGDLVTPAADKQFGGHALDNKSMHISSTSRLPCYDPSCDIIPESMGDRKMILNFSRSKMKLILIACSSILLLPQPLQAQGRQVDVVYYFGTAYDGACLYHLSSQYPDIPDDDYLVVMNEQCLWNGVENPSPPGLPVGTVDSIDCTSMSCVRRNGRLS